MAGALAGTPAGGRCSIRIDALQMLDGCAIDAVPLVDDGANGAQAETRLSGNVAQRCTSLVQLQHGGDLRVARGEWSADIAGAYRRVVLGHELVPLAQQRLVFLEPLVALDERGAPLPLTVIAQHHVE